VFVGLGFVVMIVGALRAQSGQQVSSMYLWLTYLLHTIGELCLSPVGLSAMTKLAPVRVVGLMMGVWFLAASVGNYIGGRMAAVYGSLTPPTLFSIVAVFCITFGLIMAAFVKPIRNLMGGVR
jgi:POT family proton-dependent oligopeptide transporter